MNTDILIQNLKALNPLGPLTNLLTSLAALRLNELQNEIEELRQNLKNRELCCDSWEDEVIKLRKELDETRPDPSRLEIAAMIMASAIRSQLTFEDVLKIADGLIAAAKEGGK
jgi:predicted  nucleic acid-binding Zn-ribbon protein